MWLIGLQVTFTFTTLDIPLTDRVLLLCKFLGYGHNILLIYLNVPAGNI